MLSTIRVRDEAIRRSNIYWTAYERLAVEARANGEWAKEDIRKAHTAQDEEMAHFYSYFAGSKAREAFSFAIMALDYKEKSDREAGR